MIQRAKVKDYYWNSVGVFLQNAMSPLLLIAVTRINGIYDAGVFSFAFSVSLILWAIGLWGGRTYQVSDVKREFSSQSYVAVRLITSFLILVIGLVFSVLNHYDGEKVMLIMVLVLFKVAESIADVLYGIEQLHGRLYIAGKSLTYKMILGAVFFVFTNILTKDVVLSSLGVVLVNVLIIVLYDIPHSWRFEDTRELWSRFGYHTRQALVIMKRCSRVFVVMFLAMFSLNIPRYFIDMYQPSEVGYFGIIAMPITLIAMFVSFTLQPNIVDLSVSFKERNMKAFSASVRTIILVAFCGGIVTYAITYFVGVQLLGIVFGVDFMPYRTALLIMVLGALFNALVSIYINVLTIIRRLKGQFYVLLVSNTALTVLSAIVIKDTGVTGGAVLFLAINIIQFLLLSLVYKRTLVALSNEEN